jgi:hypothetical protein
MNCCTHVLSTGFLRLVHTVVMDLCCPLKFWIFCRRVRVVGGALSVFRCLIPLYANACIMADSFAPWTLYLAGIWRSSLSAITFLIPSLASLLLSSFPWLPLCPFTYLNCVVDVYCLRRKAVFLNSGAFYMVIQLMSSQVRRSSQVTQNLTLLGLTISHRH